MRVLHACSSSYNCARQQGSCCFKRKSALATPRPTTNSGACTVYPNSRAVQFPIPVDGRCCLQHTSQPAFRMPHHLMLHTTRSHSRPAEAACKRGMQDCARGTHNATNNVHSCCSDPHCCAAQQAAGPHVPTAAAFLFKLQPRLLHLQTAAPAAAPQQQLLQLLWLNTSRFHEQQCNCCQPSTLQ